ncbi:MAG: DUF1003 domain-containing protein [Alphaproteobacteria bacterium]|nr:DUF1003 domain-containing protein [Alphaproteobacteria bacterium]
MNTHHLLQTLEHKLGLKNDPASERKRRILKHVAERTVVTRDLSQEEGGKDTFGEWLADKVAEFGGSWTFIMIFMGFLFSWAILNTIILLTNAVDPYPFIFLNLLLSMLAALQAPIIMMSQNRQSTKDRLTAQHDYEVNLKAELEIMALHEKVDLMRSDQLCQILAKHDEQIKLLTDLVKAKG